MALLGRKSPADPADKTAKPKPRVSIGRLFNPEIGASLRPMQESTRIFVQLVAMVFAAHGLFPRNHPALMGDPNARLSLSQVIGTARGNLRFTQEGLPQVLIFAAVIGCFGLGILAILTILFSLFVGKAHAATSGFSPFQPVDQTNDIALGWMNYLFFGQQMANYLSQYGQAVFQPTSVQCALISGLGYYSDAILVVAAFILFYHLASMIVETAHHGVVMGKRANQVWAPIRLVVAVGLLVPVGGAAVGSGCSGGGLNVGQYIVIQVAEWGSNLASQTWNVFLTQLTKDQYQPVLPNVPYTRTMVISLIQMDACAYAYNQYLASITSNVSALSSSQLTLQSTTLQDGSTEYGYSPTSIDDFSTNLFCGYYIIPPPPQVDTKFDSSGITSQVNKAIQQARISALQVLESDAQNYAQQNMVYFIPDEDGGKWGQSLPPNDGIEQIISDYQTELQKDYQQNLGNLNTAMQQIAQTSASQGWVSAGAWFNTIARAQDAIMDTSALLPQAHSPNLIPDGSNVAYAETSNSMHYFEQWLDTELPSTNAANPNGNSTLLLAASGLIQGAKSTSANPHIMDVILAGVDWIASWNCVWTPAGETSPCTNGQPNNYNQGNQLGQSVGNFSLGVQFTGADPFAEIAAFGHANIETAYDIFDAYMSVSALGGFYQMAGDTTSGIGGLLTKTSSRLLGGTGLFAQLLGGAVKAGGGILGALGGLLGTLSMVFFVCGFVLAYLLPLIPFFKFLFGILSWILSLLETVIAVPMIALAHLSPEGDGLPGANGKQAYYFVFNLFLRPVLMVFGLICGLLLFYLAASAMNMMYMTAVTGTGGLTDAHITLSRLVFSMLYVVALYLTANNAFKMIDWLPQHAMEWMGGRSLHHAPMGDPSDLAGYMTGAAGYADQLLVKGAGQAMQSAGPLGLSTIKQTIGKERMEKSLGQVSSMAGQLTNNPGMGKSLGPLLDKSAEGGAVLGKGMLDVVDTAGDLSTQKGRENLEARIEKSVKSFDDAQSGPDQKSGGTPTQPPKKQ